ncbi:methyl-accepting chemotaxis protein [Bacillus sp. 1P02SD]|uniref:methyl-accepting chemotaxis protein n=1 Tax=Bacillus sp. 1P02SD TaxID=3132264 RepID=UPI0039A3BED0
MFLLNRKREEANKDKALTDYLVGELQRVYKQNENYDGLSKEIPYLSGDSEIELWINKLLELKNSQIREQFLRNVETMEFVTQMDYVKDMVDYISVQKSSMDEVAASSEEMSASIEEISNFVQSSLITTNETISISTNSLDTINESFKYINQSFEGIQAVQEKMNNLVEVTKEIENVVNIINNVAGQTNLLALNASIEAARSGEAGRGFSVVAEEIKKLADNTKQSANYIKDMVAKLRGEIGVSNQTITGAVTVFTKGKEQINHAVLSMNQLEKSLGSISSVFEEISANVEEQADTTQETTQKLSEINIQTQLLNDVCIKTGQGIYDVSSLLEDTKQMALPYFKDLKGEHIKKVTMGDHLLFKWKAYNASCGFVKLNENSVGEHTTCNVGRYLENTKKTIPSHEAVQTLYIPHKKIHDLTKEVIRTVNSGNRNDINNLLKELGEATNEFLKGLKMTKL